MMSQYGQGRSNWSIKWVNFFLALWSMFFQCLRLFSLLKVPASRRYNISKTSVSFRYQLWRLCNVLSWSVSLRYQLVLVTTYQIGQFYLRTDETLQRHLKQVCLIDVPVATSWWRLSMVRDVLIYMRSKWDVSTTSHAGWDIIAVLFIQTNNCEKNNIACIIECWFINFNFVFFLLLFFSFSCSSFIYFYHIYLFWVSEFGIPN